jgi:hypothetical protein
MKKAILTTCLLVLCSFVVCLAAITGLNGKWAGTVKINEEDELSLTYNFKVDNDKLTGIVQTPDGQELPIADGIVAGNEFAFKVKAGKYTVLHTGKYLGDSVIVSADVEGKSLHATLKRTDK